MDELLRSCFEWARDVILADAMTLEREAEIIAEAFDVSIPFTRYRLRQLCEARSLGSSGPTIPRERRSYYFPGCHRDGLD